MYSIYQVEVKKMEIKEEVKEAVKEVVREEIIKGMVREEIELIKGVVRKEVGEEEMRSTLRPLVNAMGENIKGTTRIKMLNVVGKMIRKLDKIVVEEIEEDKKVEDMMREDNVDTYNNPSTDDALDMQQVMGQLEAVASVISYGTKRINSISLEEQLLKGEKSEKE